MSTGPEPKSEESWEAEISAVLGALPTVEPPAGFLTSVVDHRPLHAGRIVVASAAAVVLAVGVTVAAGLTERTVVAVDGSAFSASLSASEVSVPTVDGGDAALTTTGSEADGGIGSTLDRFVQLVDAMTRQLGFPSAPTHR